MADTRPGVMLYFADVTPMLKYMDDQQLGGFIRQVLGYAQTGAEPGDLDPMAAMAFEVMRPRIDRDADNYNGKAYRSRYASYCSACRRRGIEPVSIEEWDGVMPDIVTGFDGDRKDRDGLLRTPTDTVTDFDGDREQSYSVPTTTSTTTSTPTSTEDNSLSSIYAREDEEPEEPEETAKARQGAYYVLPSLPKWVTVDNDVKDEVTQIAKDIYTAYVPGKQVNPGICISLYNAMCEVDRSGKVYVSNERVNILKGAYLRAKQMGKPGNWNVVKFVLQKSGVAV